MLRLTKPRRELLAQNVGDLANLAMAGLAFGQALSQNTFSPSVAAAGMAIWAMLMVFTLLLQGEDR